MKAVTPVVASVMLVLITVGVTSVAYIWGSSYMSSQISHTFVSIEKGSDYSVISNRGTSPLRRDDVRVVVDGQETSVSMDEIAQGKTGRLDFFVPPGTHNIVISTSSIAERYVSTRVPKVGIYNP